MSRVWQWIKKHPYYTAATVAGVVVGYSYWDARTSRSTLVPFRARPPAALFRASFIKYQFKNHFCSQNFTF
jgi:hypothetical protein